MKISKTGIKMYESSDPIPDGKTSTQQIFTMLNMLREEISKMAVVIDKMQEEIDELKSRT